MEIVLNYVPLSATLDGLPTPKNQYIHLYAVIEIFSFLYLFSTGK